MNRLRKDLQTGVLGLVVALLAWPAWGITVYRVLVLSSTPEDLATVQTQVPDAFLVVGPERISILAGTFINQINAQKRQAELQQLGLNVEVVTTTNEDTPEPFTSPTPSTPQPSPAPAPQTPPLSPPAPPLSPGPDPGQRPLAVLVLNPTNDPNLVTRLRRFFPNAIEVLYQQQPALITGSFSQQSQAQQQTQWLNSQGFGAIVVSTAEVTFSVTPNTAPTPTPTSGEQIWVLVADPTGEKLTEIQQIVPDAIPLLYDGIRVVKAGGYPDQVAAKPQADQLTAQGYEVGLFPANLERTQPIFPGNGASPDTPAAPAAATPTPVAGEASDSNEPVTQADPVDDPEDNSEGYLVLVPQMEGSDRLTVVQSIAPDAFERRFQDQPVIQMGTYRLRESAEQAIRDLDELGLPGRIAPL